MSDSISAIPIIDLSTISGDYDTLRSNKDAFKNISKEFGKAMNSIGFAYIINHGIDMAMVDDNITLSKHFFTQSSDIKTKFNKLCPAESFHGYGGPGEEVHQSEVYSIEMHEFFDVWGSTQYTKEGYPTEVPGWKESFDKLRPVCNNLCKKLLICMAQYLQLKDDEFFVRNHSFMDNESVLTHTQFRAIYYPQINPSHDNIPARATRLGEHSDWGTITLLFQDMIGGLEVKTAEGKWIQAVPIKDSIIINGGQLMEIWSGGVFPATIHRVRLLDERRQEERQSLVYFLTPDGETEVEKLESPIISKNNTCVKVHEPLNAWEFYIDRIKDASSHY